MTDNEIIKALERMIEEDPDGFSSEILALINRQKAEIERLKGWQDLLRAEKHSLIKAGAIKEFAERLKAYLLLCQHGDLSVVSFENIDDLVNRMTGGE